MHPRSRLVFAWLIFLLGAAPVAQGALVQYQLVLNVERVFQAPRPDCLDAGINFAGNSPGTTFGCDSQVGDRHLGSFAVEESLLQSPDGLVSAPVFDFYLRINDF